MFALERRGRQRSVNIWPGFVDALSTLLLVVIFVLMVFMVAQYFLSTALSGRDAALERLQRQVAELGELLALERAESFRLQSDFNEISEELNTSLSARETLSGQVSSLTEERDQLRNQLSRLAGERDDLSSRLDQAVSSSSQVSGELEDAYKTIEADKEKIEAQLAELAILKSLRDDLRAQLAASKGDLALAEAEKERLNTQLSEQVALTEEAQVQAELLNRQILALRQQLAQLSEALDRTEAKNKEQEVQIADLGRRLNVALATKVQELARYRSEFFGRLRQVLGDRPDIQVVGDRFVFQSEILFETGSAALGSGGRVQMSRLANTLNEISRKIPDEIDWVLRVDGHTDRRPISTAEFPSNWELSTARAISVVRFLIGEGVPARRLAATGFGEFQPIDTGNDEVAFRRNRRIELKFTQR
ncbi:MAG: peptidoglycan -binding protein [Kiloniellales bacterium]|nr:peptidoglycan -binding protein [Kiloniellales bacterium]